MKWTLMSKEGMEAFWAKVVKTDTCWLWTGGRTDVGYAGFRREGVHYYAHRFAYELHRGPIPEGLDIDHLCRVRHCVNPDHLEPVTRRENAARGIKGVLTTHCPVGHPYDEKNTHHNKLGHRTCRTCHCIREQARHARLRQLRSAERRRPALGEPRMTTYYKALRPDGTDFATGTTRPELGKWMPKIEGPLVICEQFDILYGPWASVGENRDD